MDEGISPLAKSRPWLTMLHGFSQNAKVFDSQKRYFEQKYQVFTPELLGHGLRNVQTSDYSISSHAQDVLAQMREQGIEHTHFWGTHTGAAVGLVLALEQPRMISSLILEGAVVPGIDVPTVAARFTRARTIAMERGVQAAMEDWFQQAEWFRTIRENPVKFRAAQHLEIILEFKGHPLLVDAPAANSYSLSNRVGEIGCPVLFYNGSDDVEDFKKTATWLAEHLPSAEQVILPELGGFPVWESPDCVNVIVDGFLSRISS